jgi:hypothetical protein
MDIDDITSTSIKIRFVPYVFKMAAAHFIYKKKKKIIIKKSKHQKRYYYYTGNSTMYR